MSPAPDDEYHVQAAKNRQSRSPIDPAQPWLEAGRSWQAQADRVAAYLEQRHGRRPRWWQDPDPEVLQLRRRAEACRWHAQVLDAYTPRGWVVWHDRLAPGTRSVVDHVMVGAAGVVAIQTLAAEDHVRTPDGQRMGPHTHRRAQSSGVRAGEILACLQEEIADLFDAGELDARMLGSGSLDLRVLTVLVDDKDPATYEVAVRPFEVEAVVEEMVSRFEPPQVARLAGAVEQLMPPAPLEG